MNWPKALPTDYQRKVCFNAARLVSDAKLLCRHDRYPSAFALAVLGLEEVGKFVLDLWYGDGTPSSATAALSHIKKQYAVAAILMAKRIADEDNTKGNKTDEEFLEIVVDALIHSKEGIFKSHVEIKALDRTKQLSLYIDGSPKYAHLDASQFTAEDVQSVIEKANAAMELILETKAVLVGKALYESRFKRAAAIEDGSDAV